MIAITMAANTIIAPLSGVRGCLGNVWRMCLGDVQTGSVPTGSVPMGSVIIRKSCKKSV